MSPSDTNDAEDHALVLASADDFSLNKSNLSYTGSNLGIAGADSLTLANASITTGAESCSWFTGIIKHFYC